MNRDLIVSQGIPFSVLFPRVHQMVTDALVRQFYSLQFRCVKTLLFVCAEKLTRYAVSLPVRPNTYEIPYLNLSYLNGISVERIESLVCNWHDIISVYDDADIARAAYPKVFEFVRDQILLKEPGPVFISEDDIAALCALVIKNSTIFYKGKWVLNDKQIALMFERWFTADQCDLPE